jgi:hypothetical protein
MYTHAYHVYRYYVGPYCSFDGKSVKLGVFVDAGCSMFAPSGVYETLYGVPLPYSTTSIIRNDCVSCDTGNYAASDMCKNSYSMALGRCETNLQNGNAYPDTSGCNYIQHVLPMAEQASRTAVRTRGEVIQIATYVATGLFAVLSVLLGVYSFLLYRRLKRRNTKVALSEKLYNASVDAQPTAQA